MLPWLPCVLILLQRYFWFLLFLFDISVFLIFDGFQVETLLKESMNEVLELNRAMHAVHEARAAWTDSVHISSLSKTNQCCSTLSYSVFFMLLLFQLRVLVEVARSRRAHVWLLRSDLTELLQAASQFADTPVFGESHHDKPETPHDLPNIERQIWNEAMNGSFKLSEKSVLRPSLVAPTIITPGTFSLHHFICDFHFRD
jgi:hypothetical protein